MENEYEGERPGMIDKFNVRTDLALEEKERFESDYVEISGVVLEEHYDEQKEIRITMVKIETEKGARTMGKPVGNYLTLEAPGMADDNEEIHRDISDELEKLLRCILKDHKGKQESVLVVGLGNRMVTPDALGPYVADHLNITRHVIREYGRYALHDQRMRLVSAIVPGVMGQTGMETVEIVKGIVKETKPDLVIAIDALAARNTKRLNRTIQVADTGIQPGSGVGNHAFSDSGCVQHCNHKKYQPHDYQYHQHTKHTACQTIHQSDYRKFRHHIKRENNRPKYD